MKIIFIVRQSLDIFWIVEYNFDDNQDKKSHRYSEGRAFMLKSIDPLHNFVDSRRSPTCINKYFPNFANLKILE